MRTRRRLISYLALLGTVAFVRIVVIILTSAHNRISHYGGIGRYQRAGLPPRSQLRIILHRYVSSMSFLLFSIPISCQYYDRPFPPRLEPQSPVVLAHLGMAYDHRLNDESAAETLEESLAGMDESDINARFTLTLGLSHIYKKPEECHRALPWLHKTLEFAPGLSSALHGLRLCASGS